MPSSPFDVEEATIDDIHAAIKGGPLTSRDLVEAYLRRIEGHDRGGPALNSILALNAGARERADELDEQLARTGELSGPLHGIPIVVKDCIETSEIPTTFGSVTIDGYLPREDAATVALVRQAGAIVLAKTTLPDFASSWFSYSSVSEETKNPYALDYDPGGSSSGSAAAVAANLAAVGIGTDCGGSIRLPSSFCNVVGVRSTPGVVSRRGSSYLVIFQDTIGPIARTVADAATLFDAMVGYDERDPYTAAYLVARAPQSYRSLLDAGALAGARLGLITNALGTGDAAAAVNDVMAAAAGSIREAGGEVVDVSIPDLSRHIEATSQYVARSKHDINAFLAERPQAGGLTLQEIVERHQYHPQLDLIEAMMDGPDDPEDDPDYFRRVAAREEFTRVVLNVMGRHRLDALICPTCQLPPPSMRDRADWTTLTFPTNTLIASQTWTPAITVPAGFTSDGLPVGLELIGKPYDEPTVFRLGYAFEQATQHRRAPQSTSAA